MPAHGQAPSELIATNRGVSKSSNVPKDVREGLESARQAADSLPRRGDREMQGIDERKPKMREAVSDLKTVKPKYRAPYRMWKRTEEAKAALGAHSLFGTTHGPT